MNGTPPSPPPTGLRRAVWMLGIACSLTLAAACTGSGGGSTATPPSAPSATSGSAPSDRAASSTRPTPTTRSSPGTTASSVDAAEACALLPEADVAEAFGESVVAGTQSTDECWWSTANDLKTVNLIRRTEQDLDTWRSGYQNGAWREIDLGDEGYAGRALDTITFRKGDTTYEVNVVFSTKGDPEQVVQDLTQKVVGRL